MVSDDVLFDLCHVLSPEQERETKASGEYGDSNEGKHTICKMHVGKNLKNILRNISSALSTKQTNVNIQECLVLEVERQGPSARQIKCHLYIRLQECDKV